MKHMNRDEYIARLRQVYDKFYDSSSGRCKFFAECKEDNAVVKFESDRANVGEFYGENPDLPRIVIVGLEALGKEGVVRDICCPSSTAYNPHYKGVRYVLAYLLSEWNDKPKPENSLKRVLSQYSDETIGYYSLLNCYKCAFAARAQQLPHTTAMKRYCQEILFEEIEALDPDILVIQVKNDRPEEIEKRFREKYDYSGPLEGDNTTGVFSMVLPSGTQTLVVWTYHGSSNPYRTSRSWTNDNRNGSFYIKKDLDKILERTIKEYKQKH